MGSWFFQENQVNACCDLPQFFTSPSNYQRQACQEELKNMALDRNNQIVVSQLFCRKLQSSYFVQKMIIANKKFSVP